jgi:ABC-type transporter Mla subunit MlaD
MQKFPQVGLRAVFEISGFNRNYRQYERAVRDIDRITSQTARGVTRSGQRLSAGFAQSIDELAQKSELLSNFLRAGALSPEGLDFLRDSFAGLSQGVGVNVEKFDELILSGATLSEAFEGAQGQIEGLTGSVNILGRSFTASAVAIGAITTALGVSVRFVQRSIAEYIELSEATRRLRAETGLLAEEASGWVQVAQASGVSANTASRGLAQFLGRVSDLRREQELGQESTSDFAEALEFLNVSLTDSDGNLKSTQELLSDVNAAFQDLGPGIQTAGVAQDLFGRTGRQLLPILTDQQQSLNQYLATLDRFGARLGALNQKEYEEFLQAQFELRAAIQGVRNTIASQWIPVLTQVQRIAAAGINIWRTFTQILSVTGIASRGLAAELEATADTLERVDRLVQRVARATQFLRDVLDPAGAVTRALAQAEEERAQAMAQSAQAAAESARLEQQRQEALQETLENLSELQGQYADKLADIERDAAQKWEETRWTGRGRKPSA